MYTPSTPHNAPWAAFVVSSLNSTELPFKVIVPFPLVPQLSVYVNVPVLPSNFTVISSIFPSLCVGAGLVNLKSLLIVF